MPKADNTEDTTVSEETTAEETVDTSTNEETPDTDVTTELEDDETSFDDEDDDETEEAEEDSEDEETDTEPAETEEESKEGDESEDSNDAEEDTTSDEDKKSGYEGLSNAEAAAKRVAEKQAREAAKLEQQNKYLQEAEDAKDLALRQLQVDAYNNRVEKNTNNLESGIERAVASIDLFRDGSPEVKEELARRLDDFEAKHVQYDSNGDPVQVTGNVYEYLLKEADSIRRILNTGARNQVKAKDKAKARTEAIPTRAPKEPKVDPDMAAFDEEIAKWE